MADFYGEEDDERETETRLETTADEAAPVHTRKQSLKIIKEPETAEER